MGGSVGNTFSDPKVAGFWHEVNKQISDLLYDSLVLDKYKVVKLTVSVAQSSDNERLVLEALARNRCNRVIQVSHTVDEDTSGGTSSSTSSWCICSPREPARRAPPERTS